MVGDKRQSQPKIPYPIADSSLHFQAYAATNLVVRSTKTELKRLEGSAAWIKDQAAAT